MTVPAVLVVDDHAPFCSAARRMLEEIYPEAKVLEAPTLGEARAHVNEHPELRLALVDLGLPDGSGIDLVRDLATSRPAATIVVATIYDDDAHLFPALTAGAHGYLLKDGPLEVWKKSLLALEEGMPALSPSIARRILAHVRDRPLAPSSPRHDQAVLTARETDVLTHIGRGLRVGEVAGVLGLSESTVAGYVKEIYRKLKISSRAEAAIEAVRRGLA